jgi:hypothetical protein
LIFWKKRSPDQLSKVRGPSIEASSGVLQPFTGLLHLNSAASQSVSGPLPEKTMTFLLVVVAWFLLLAVAWPLALAVLVFLPILWLLSLPFRFLAVCVSALFAFVKALLFLPARLLAGKPAH